MTDDEWNKLVAYCDDVRKQGMSDDTYRRLTNKMAKLVAKHRNQTYDDSRHGAKWKDN